MKHFPETLKALMALHDPPLTGLSLASLTQISSSTISRVLSGQQRATAEHVGQLCAVISSERKRRVELLLAYLRDVAAASLVAGIDERHFVISHAGSAASPMAGSIAADLELLAEECAKHDDIRALVSDLARMTMRHRAEVVDTPAAVVPFVTPAAAGSVNPAAQVLSALKRRAASADGAPADKASPVPRK